MNNNNIKIKNFGPIKNANINIKPLTIFVGQNNSGKSYTSLLINSLQNPFDESVKLESFSLNSVQQLVNNNFHIFEEYYQNFMEYLDSKKDFCNEPFKIPVEKFEKLIYEGIGKEYLRLIENRLKDNFTKDLNKLNNTQTTDSFQIEYNNTVFINNNGALTLKKFNNHYNNDEIKSENEEWLLSIKREKNEILITFNYLTFKDVLQNKERFPLIIYSTLADIFVTNSKNKSLHIPASGHYITNNYNAFIAKEINGINKATPIEKNLLTSYLNSKREIKDNTFYKIATKIENELLGGEIKFKKNDIGEELIFKDNIHKTELNFSLVSSSVKQLTPLINYLKYELHKGDTLIIEEIESHLHPNNQRILVKYLVNLANNGLNIIITTHSDFILEQFNNFIRLNGINKKELKKLNYTNKDVINSNDISVYNFKNNENNEINCKSVNLNKTGFIDDEFTPVIEDLYNESVTIINLEER